MLVKASVVFRMKVSETLFQFGQGMQIGAVINTSITQHGIEQHITAIEGLHDSIDNIIFLHWVEALNTVVPFNVTIGV